jgi:hypothetical protein
MFYLTVLNSLTCMVMFLISTYFKLDNALFLIWLLSAFFSTISVYIIFNLRQKFKSRDNFVKNLTSLVLISIASYAYFNGRIFASPDLKVHISYVDNFEKLITNSGTDLNLMNYYPLGLHLLSSNLSILLPVNPKNILIGLISILLSTIIINIIKSQTSAQVKLLLLIMTITIFPIVSHLLNRGFFTFVFAILFFMSTIFIQFHLYQILVLMVASVFIHPSSIPLTIVILAAYSLNNYKKNVISVRPLITIAIFSAAMYFFFKKIGNPAFTQNAQKLDVDIRAFNFSFEIFTNLFNAIKNIIPNFSLLIVWTLWAIIIFTIRKSLFLPNLILVIFVVSIFYVVLPFFLGLNDFLSETITLITVFSNSEPDRGSLLALALFFQSVYYLSYEKEKNKLEQ